MDDKNIRIECLRQAYMVATMVGERRSVLEIAKELYSFVTRQEIPA